MRHVKPLFLFAALFALAACSDDSQDTKKKPSLALCPNGQVKLEGQVCPDKPPIKPERPKQLWDDPDADGKISLNDNCPLVPNASQQDLDSDGVGDVCDNCKDTANALQVDSNQDGTGDACTNQTFDYNPNQDSDGDGIKDVNDNCMDKSNADQSDLDDDGVGDVCDNCPTQKNPRQVNTSGQGEGDACQPVPTGPICVTQEVTAEKLSPNIFILLDRSSSMREDDKWNKAIAAINTIADTLSSDARFGLATFDHSQGQCGPSLRRLALGAHNAAAIKMSVAGLMPSSGTPTAIALSDVLQNKWTDDSNDAKNAQRKKAVVIITDGKSNDCAGGHTGAVDKIKALKTQNITTYAIGFGAGANPAQLGDYAQAGGSAQYYTANDTNTLVTALRNVINENIGCRYAIDAKSDEFNPSLAWVERTINGQTQQVQQSDTDGFRYDAVSNTITISGTACDALTNSPGAKIKIDLGCPNMCMPVAEACDFIDNNCDGQVDEGCAGCSPEVCDMKDNDCDGVADNGCCKPLGNACGQDLECCTGRCISGICEVPCRPVEAPCTDDAQCCTGICAKSAGQSTGSCISN